VVAGQLRCGYHGWRFDGEGSCVEIPANKPGAAIPRRARIRTLPCREAHGFLWLWWDPQGSHHGEPPPLPPVEHVPAAGHPGWRNLEGEQEWTAHWVRILEGFLDLTHVPYVHRSTFGGAAANELYTSEEIVAGDYLYGLIDTPRDRQYRSEQGNPLQRLLAGLGGAGKEGTEAGAGGGNGVQHLHLWLANLLLIRVEFRDFKIYLCLVPVPLGGGRTRLLWRHFRSFLRTPLADGNARQRVHRFLGEDQVILESMQPFEPDLDGREDLLLASDSLTLALRRLLRNKREANLILE
jgi:phenylpropionate dioxygenase-like ring-hydroxylating dioxygenase large terminal subunit